MASQENEKSRRAVPASNGANPVLVEIIRGGALESCHRGAVAVVDSKGNKVLSYGDITRPVFPRSAIKALQCLPLIETGAADALGFSGAEIALACASHLGEPAHIKSAQAMLEKMQLDEDALECGAHWPSHAQAARELEGPARQIHNNCSGKHCGMLAVSTHLCVPHQGYTQPDHQVQLGVRKVLEDMCDVDLECAPRAIDGCSVPNWALPLDALAFGFARFGASNTLGRVRGEASARIMAAVFENPYMVTGTGGYSSDVMTILKGQAFVKNGAEGVYIAALPKLGLGIALKCDDGSPRGAQLIMSHILQRLGVISNADKAAMAPFLEPELVNSNGLIVGKIVAGNVLG